MGKLTKKQIEFVKSLKPFDRTNFHGNRKQINGLPIEFVKSIIEKKRQREKMQYCTSLISDAAKIRYWIGQELQYKGTNYFKIMIEGNTGIYLASPVYGHSDYNKKRIFDKNEKTLKLMQIFNSIVTK